MNQPRFTVRVDREHIRRVIAERRRLGYGEGFRVVRPALPIMGEGRHAS
jgi:hypothetical protein